MTVYYCTYFDRGYLGRGLALYRSLTERHIAPFVLWVLCFDDFTYDVLVRLNQPNLKPIALAEFERDDPALLQAKLNRSRVEYYFTCTPSWPLHLLNRHREIDLITYLDADLYFFADPAPIFAELGNASILIIAHRFPERLRYLESHGVYNVGFLSFRNDTAGRECLQWWRERCLEWCYDRPEGGRFADQKYLDDWPIRFTGVIDLQHKGANLAPWNWMNYTIQQKPSPPTSFRQGEGSRLSARANSPSLLAERGLGGEVNLTVDGQSLIFYHYHGLKIFNAWLYDPGTAAYGRMPSALRRQLYTPYINALKGAETWLRERVPGIDPTYSGIYSRGYGKRTFLKRLAQGQLALFYSRQPARG